MNLQPDRQCPVRGPSTSGSEAPRTVTLSVLDRFVLRARRIAAHSLARDREELAALSQLKFDGQLSLDGTMTFRRTLPDEEIFESLAARLRPLLVPGETVFHKKVFKAFSAQPPWTPAKWRSLVRSSTAWRKWSGIGDSSTFGEHQGGPLRDAVSGCRRLHNHPRGVRSATGGCVALWRLGPRRHPRQQERRNALSYQSRAQFGNSPTGPLWSVRLGRVWRPSESGRAP